MSSATAAVQIQDDRPLLRATPLPALRAWEPRKHSSDWSLLCLDLARECAVVVVVVRGRAMFFPRAI